MGSAQKSSLQFQAKTNLVALDVDLVMVNLNSKLDFGDEPTHGHFRARDIYRGNGFI